MKTKNYLLFSLIFFLKSCGGDALTGKTRSERNDEFLVEKKNPLSMPPDFNEMPEPSSDNVKNYSSTDNDIKEILNIKDATKSDKTIEKGNTSLDEKILEKINN